MLNHSALKPQFREATTNLIFNIFGGKALIAVLSRMFCICKIFRLILWIKSSYKILAPQFFILSSTYALD
jgi:hypothetical protein